MKKISLVLLFVMSTSSVARADERVVQDIPPGEDKIVPLREGQVAPFSGQLFDSQTALRWSNWLLQYKLRLKADVDYQKRASGAEIDFLNKKISITEEKYKTVTNDYQKQVAGLQTEVSVLNNELRNPPWYKSVWFGVLIGVVVTGAFVGLGAYIAK